MPSSRTRRQKRALKRIHEAAAERQHVWLAGGNQDLTDALGHKLDRAYLDLRRERADGTTTRPHLEGGRFHSGIPGGQG
jgi:hypothetical protein